MAPSRNAGARSPGCTFVHRAALASLALPLSAQAQEGVAEADVLYEPGFVVETVAVGLAEPIALDFTPDGRMVVAERGGSVRFVRDGAVSTPLISIEVYTTNENGLVGMAVDPDFAATHAIYLYATISTREAQIIRVVEQDGVAVDVDIVRDNLPTEGGFHSGGGLRFGPDGKLYFAIGDNLRPENSQDMSTLAGKISRINADGTTPADNPFTTPTGQPRAIYALGFRNPFRFCFAPDGRIFALDVGSDNAERREELNLVVRGGNYGWPLVEGIAAPGTDPAYRDPIYAYHDGGAAPVGAVYYTGLNFPAAYEGNLFHLEYVLNRLYRVVLDGDRVASYTVFLQGSGGPVDLAQGPDGMLYYSEIESGNIKRIRALTPRVLSDGAADGDAGSADDGAGDGTSGDSVSGDAPRIEDEQPDGPRWLAPGGLCGAGVTDAALLGMLVACAPRSRPRRGESC